MTSRAISGWFAVGACLLAFLVAVDRPHWFGLQARAAGIADHAASRTVMPVKRSAPWRIARSGTAER